MHLHTAEVTWMGDFPIDMLRYCGAFPIHEMESYEILKQQPDRKTITIGKYTKDRDDDPFWCQVRWQSFGATIKPT